MREKIQRVEIPNIDFQEDKMMIMIKLQIKKSHGKNRKFVKNNIQVQRKKNLLKGKKNIYKVSRVVGKTDEPKLQYVMRVRIIVSNIFPC
jgi:hypothetical protein